MTSTAVPVLRRALLYVPASSQKMLSKSLTFTSDNITYDLEDSVTPQNKAPARDALRSHLSSINRPAAVSEVAVRINAISTPHALADLTTLAMCPSIDAIVIPKVNRAADLTLVHDVLRHVAPERHCSKPGADLSPRQRPPIKLIALIESARAVMDLPAICAASPLLSGLIFAAEDFALDLSATRTLSLREFLYARSAVVTAARAFDLVGGATDLVCTTFRGAEGAARLADECRDGRELGFSGKQCIHPSQVDVVQQLFAPTDGEVEWAIRVVVAGEKAESVGRGAWTLDGKMIDAPVTGRARAVVTKAEACGFDVKELREKWKEQEPE